MAVEQMLCYSKLEQLFHRVYPALRNFPVSEKFAMSQQIKLGFLNSLKGMQLANTVKSKRKDYLMEVEAELLHLNTIFRLCRNQKYLSKGFFEDIDLNSLIAYNSYLRGCNSYNFRKQHFKEIDIHDIFFRQQV